MLKENNILNNLYFSKIIFFKKDLLLSMAVKRKDEVFLVQVAGSVSGSAMYLPSACT
jgi:hypothetical protein